MGDKQRFIFISAVTDEFADARTKVGEDLRARYLQVKVQEEFTQGVADTTLGKLHNYIKTCFAVVCIIGKRCGSFPPPEAARAFQYMLLDGFEQLSYTQWEVIFAGHYDKRRSIHLAHYTKDLKALAASEPDPKKRQEIESQDRFITGYLKSKGLDRNYFPDVQSLQNDILRESWPDDNPFPSRKRFGFGAISSGTKRHRWVYTARPVRIWVPNHLKAASNICSFSSVGKMRQWTFSRSSNRSTARKISSRSTLPPARARPR